MKGICCAAVVVLTVLHCTSAAPWYQSVFSSSGEEEQYTAPDFCKGYECAKYTVIESYDGYELREYEPTVWVTTKMPQMESDFWEDRGAMSGIFMKLFRYIRGANDQQQKIDMTVPVLNTHTKDSVYMGFMVPAKFAANPPTPTDSSVEIYRAPTGQFYVRTFSGWAYGFFNNKNYFKDELVNVVQKMESAGQSYDKTMFFTASYNSPWDFFNRHNEVWVPKQ